MINPSTKKLMCTVLVLFALTGITVCASGAPWARLWIKRPLSRPLPSPIPTTRTLPRIKIPKLPSNIGQRVLLQEERKRKEQQNQSKDPIQRQK